MTAISASTEAPWSLRRTRPATIPAVSAGNATAIVRDGQRLEREQRRRAAEQRRGPVALQPALLPQVQRRERGREREGGEREREQADVDDRNMVE